MSFRTFKSNLLCLTVVAATLLPALASQPSLESALNRLSTVPTFAIGGVGFAGSTSAGENDFLIVLANSHALADFENLYRNGNAQAKAYALLGVYSIDPTRFRVLSSPLYSSSEKVTTMRGCIGSTQTLATVIKDIGAGGFRPLPRTK